MERWVRAGKRVGELERYVMGGEGGCLGEVEGGGGNGGVGNGVV